MGTESKNPADVLRFGHVAISDGLEQVLINVRSYQKAKPAIRNLELVILSHFRLQTVVLYTELRDFYHEDREKVKLIESLVVDLKGCKINTMMFFDSYPGESFSRGKDSEFPVRVQHFVTEISERINLEHLYLEPLLDQFYQL